MRHAKSSWEDSSLRDFDRPLNGRGERDAPRMGQFLKQKGLIPDQIFSSPAARAKATILSVVHELGLGEESITWTENLYFSGASAYIEAIQSADETSELVMTTGHNPMTEQIVELLAGDRRSLRMATAAIACFESDAETWEQVTQSNCKMLWLQVPKEL